ncbi:MAG TPA: hypothetical protein V6C76_09085 [Drouetiella sp.]
MNSELEAAERAEFIQSVKALLIPLCLFLACVVGAAGTFLIYNHEPLGWAFALVSAVTIITCIVWLIRFQNKHRARGILKHGMEAEALLPENHAESDTVSEPQLSVVEPSNVVEFKPTKQRQNQ